MKRALAGLGSSLGDAGFDGAESETIGQVEMGEALADRPLVRRGLPLPLFSGEAVGDGFGVAQIGVDFYYQHGDIGIQWHLHYNIRFSCA